MSSTFLPQTDPYTPEIRAEALELVDAGTSISETHRRLGVSRKTIARWLKKRGRDMRPESVDAPTTWRCYCTPFGVVVTGNICLQCGESLR